MRSKESFLAGAVFLGTILGGCEQVNSGPGSIQSKEVPTLVPPPIPTAIPRPLSERMKVSYDGGPEENKSFVIRLIGKNQFLILTPGINLSPDDDLARAEAILVEQCPDAKVSSQTRISRIFRVVDDLCFPPTR